MVDVYPITCIVALGGLTMTEFAGALILIHFVQCLVAIWLLTHYKRSKVSTIYSVGHGIYRITNSNHLPYCPPTSSVRDLDYEDDVDTERQYVNGVSHE
jgi:hypothetical protein